VYCILSLALNLVTVMSFRYSIVIIVVGGRCELYIVSELVLMITGFPN